MKTLRLYPALSVAVAIFQVVDAFIVHANKGSIGGFAFIVGLVELVWAFFSFLTFFGVVYKPTRRLALAFLVYAVFDFFESIFILYTTQGSLWELPKYAVLIHGVFGVSFGLAALCVVMLPSSEGEETSD